MHSSTGVPPQKVSRATHFACVTASLISRVVCRHGGCHLALLGRERARLLQANDSSAIVKRVADPSRRCIPRRMRRAPPHTGNRVCQSLMSDGFGSLPDLRAAFLGALAPGRRLGLHPISAPLLTSTCWWRCRENSIKPSTSPLLLPCVTATVCDDRSFVPPRSA